MTKQMLNERGGRKSTSLFSLKVLLMLLGSSTVFCFMHSHMQPVQHRKYDNRIKLGMKHSGDSYSMGVGSPGLSNKGLSRYLMEISKARLKHLDQQDRLISQVRKLAIYNQKKKELEEELGREVSDAEWAKKVNLHEVDLRVDLTRFHNSRAALISSNLSLVTAIAKSYQNRGLNYHDLIQEGNMGLIHAAEKYEPEKGVKFATYAVLWIKQRIMRALAQHSRLIRIPVHVHEKMVILKRETGRLQEELGREPLPEEVARRLNLTPEKLRHYVKSVEVPLSLELAAFAGSATRARSAATLADRAAHGEAGDDDLYGGGGGLGAGDFPAHLGLDLVGWGQAGGLEAGEGGSCGGAAAARAEAALLRDAVARLLASELSPREREVLLARYGLEGAPSSPTGAGGPAGGGGRRPAQAGRPASAAEVSKRFNVSVGKIRSIEDRALNKLRSPRRNAHLKRFLEADPRVLSAKKGSAAPPPSINAAARHLNALGAARLWEEDEEAPSAAAAAEEGGARRARRPARRPGSPRYVGEAPLL